MCLGSEGGRLACQPTRSLARSSAQLADVPGHSNSASGTVTEDKLLLFMVEEVANHPLRGKSRRVAPGVPAERTRLAWHSVQGYVTAITDLHRSQKALGMNCHLDVVLFNIWFVREH
jgi:hypothetical protein